jgi:hypothetical protein
VEDLAFLGGIALLLGAVALGYRRWQRHRTEGLRRLSLERGWKYVGREDGLVDAWAAHFPLFDAGERPRRCTDVIVAERRGATVTFADYSHAEWSTDSDGRSTTSTQRHALAVAELPAALPTVRVSSESVFTRIGNRLGLSGIEIGWPEFDRRFRVRGDEPAARTLLHPGMVQLLLGQRYQTWEVSGPYLLVSRRGRWKVEDYLEVGDLVESFAAGVPRELWQRDVPMT